MKAKHIAILALLVFVGPAIAYLLYLQGTPGLASMFAFMALDAIFYALFGLDRRS